MKINKIVRKNKYRNIFNDVKLHGSNRSISEVAESYRKNVPDSLTVKLCTVLSPMSRLLLNFKDEGLIQDRLFVSEVTDCKDATYLTDVIYNRSYSSSETIFTSALRANIDHELEKYYDGTVLFRHNSTTESQYNLYKTLELIYEHLNGNTGDDDTTRFVPVLSIDNAGLIPEEYPFYQIPAVSNLEFDDNIELRGIIGEMDTLIVKYVEQNPDAAKQLLHEAVVAAKDIVSQLPIRARSSSSVMFLSTAIMLAKFGFLADKDLRDMFNWLKTESKTRTNMKQLICKAVGESLSESICSVSLSISNQSRPPFWMSDKAFIASDGSINIKSTVFFDLVLSQLGLSVGHNKVYQALKCEDYLITNPGENIKTRTVTLEDGSKDKQRFVSLSRNLLSEKAKRVVDVATASDLFHKCDKLINSFFPLVKHQRLDMVAGQIITDYKHGTPFIDVTGAQGAGKSDWIMMQMLQRAKAGDVVIVLDPTNAFCREELSAHMIPEEIIDKYVEFWDMSTEGFPVNIPDYEGCTNIQQKVERLSSLLISGMHLTGPMQKLILVSKVREWLADKPINNTYELPSLRTIMGETADEKKLRSRMNALFSTVNMYSDVPFSWADRLSAKGKILVISSGNANINEHANPFDVVLDSLYSFKDIHRDEKVTIIMDEFQTLNRYKGCTLEALLSRGRKLNLSAILASQDYTDKKDPLGRFYAYCGTHVFFRPLGEECVKAISELTKLDANVIRTLPDFNCAVLGPIYSEYYQKNIQLHSAIIGETYRPDYVGSYD